MPWRKQLNAELEAARASKAQAEDAIADVARRTPEVNSVADLLRARGARNHFGQEFEVTFTPRRRPS